MLQQLGKSLVVHISEKSLRGPVTEDLFTFI